MKLEKLHFKFSKKKRQLEGLLIFIQAHFFKTPQFTKLKKIQVSIFATWKNRG